MQTYLKKRKKGFESGRLIRGRELRPSRRVWASAGGPVDRQTPPRLGLQQRQRILSDLYSPPAPPRELVKAMALPSKRLDFLARNPNGQKTGLSA